MRFLFGIVLIILISSCGDEQVNIDDCGTPFDTSVLINDKKSAGRYISELTEEDGALQLTFDDESVLSISLECIEYYEVINDELLDIKLENFSNIFVGVNQFYDIRYRHNPIGHTPLSGLLSIKSEDSGEVTVTIKNKTFTNDDFVYHHNESSKEMDVPIHGLYFNHNNEIVINFKKDDGTSFDLNIFQRTEPLPDYLPEIIVTQSMPEKMEPGMNLISFRSKNDPTVPFMIDRYGDVRYLLDYSSSSVLRSLNFDVGVERLQNGNFYFGDWPSSDLYEVDMFGAIINQWDISGYEFHHNVQEKQNGNFLVTVSKNGAQLPSGEWSIEDHVIEVDRSSGRIIREWDLRKSLDVSRDVHGRDAWDDVVDWAHNNAVIEDPSDNSIIVSCRRQGLIKLDQSNNVKWILNCHYSWGSNERGQNLNDFLLTPLDQSGIEITDQEILNGFENHPEFEWSWTPHAPFIHPDGSVFCFDNGDMRNFSFRDFYSRAVGFKIDESNMTIQQVFDYGKERGRETFSSIVSDVDYLPEKDNILFSPGAGVQNGGGFFGGKVVEVDYSTRQVVFELRLNSFGIVFHRTERMPLYPD